MQRYLLAIIALLVGACSPKVVHPRTEKSDMQELEGLRGALTGGISGAITGAQLSGATGPGALIGASLGAVSGSIRGAGLDTIERSLLMNRELLSELKGTTIAQDFLKDHFRKRIELHPGYDLYPADVFFEPASGKLSPLGLAIATEIAKINEHRKDWSRLGVISYVVGHKKQNENTVFSYDLTNKRALAIANQFIRSGIEGRRVLAIGKVVEKPVLVDPIDTPTRYAQAIEIRLLDYK